MRSSTLLLILFLIGCSPSYKSIEVGDAGSKLTDFRREHIKSLVENEKAPLKKKDLKYLRFYDEKPQLNVLALFRSNSDPEPFNMPTYSGRQKEFVRYGTAHFTLDGVNLTLDIFQNTRILKIPGYKDHLFLPFKDVTNGEATYGGGRYIDMRTGDVDGDSIRIDFNRAYNPWCAYSDGFNCPIPPLNNHLPVAIEAGERNYTGPKRSQ
ncbi:MAG: DUF1684 domain-containing protein [Saprospiraceae bacterium]|nr:DUF1684 domain-containing protein [Saprospiraceae bacterium]